MQVCTIHRDNIYVLKFIDLSPVNENAKPSVVAYNILMRIVQSLLDYVYICMLVVFVVVYGIYHKSITVDCMLRLVQTDYNLQYTAHPYSVIYAFLIF